MSVYNLGNVTPELPNDDEYWIAPTAAVDGEPADLVVPLELTGVERAFAQLSLQSSLAHQGLLRGQEKRASRAWERPWSCG